MVLVQATVDRDVHPDLVLVVKVDALAELRILVLVQAFVYTDVHPLPEEVSWVVVFRLAGSTEVVKLLVVITVVFRALLEDSAEVVKLVVGSTEVVRLVVGSTEVVRLLVMGMEAVV